MLDLGTSYQHRHILLCFEIVNHALILPRKMVEENGVVYLYIAAGYCSSLRSCFKVWAWRFHMLINRVQNTKDAWLLHLIKGKMPLVQYNWANRNSQLTGTNFTLLWRHWIFYNNWANSHHLLVGSYGLWVYRPVACCSTWLLNIFSQTH